MPTAAYLGTTSLLLPLEWVQSVRVDAAGSHVIQEATHRSWAFATRGGGPANRSWSVSLTASASTLANLEAIAAGGFGPGPFRWVSEAAYVSNVLTPAQSLVFPALGGPAQMVDGYAPRSAIGPVASDLAAGVPVLPGAPVTIAVDASGPATLEVLWRNAQGTLVDTTTKTDSGTGMRRVSVSAPSAPPGARTVDIRVSGHVVAGRPQVTWTRSLQPWAPGEGAESVLIEDVSRAAMHFDGKRGLLHDIQLRIKEVG